MKDTNWKPERKILGAALATLAVWVLQAVTGTDVPIGVEGALATVAAYLLPNA